MFVQHLPVLTISSCASLPFEACACRPDSLPVSHALLFHDDNRFDLSADDYSESQLDDELQLQVFLDEHLLQTPSGIFHSISFLPVFVISKRSRSHQKRV